MSLKYRPDIDGLRAMAVIPVVLFHAGVPGFSGGFVGVDVFFVISGYLITGVLLRDFEERRFSILGFYERRIRRIFPALAVLLVFVAVSSPFFLLTSELKVLPKEILGTLFFVANIVFWRESGYFAPDADEKPLLHMWSLGVEEQFYIFAPIALFLIVRYARPYLVYLTAAVLLVSLGLSIFLTPIAPNPAFYLLPTRAWELLAGAMIAFGQPARHSRIAADIASLLGLALLLGSIYLLTPELVFPGYLAVFPVLGASLVIAAGQDSVIARVLSSRILVGVGLISYSLYLWHWPLVVYARDLQLLDYAVVKLVILVLSASVAWLSWRYVERPFRDRVRWSARGVYAAAGASSVLIFAMAFGLQMTKGWPSRWSAEVNRFDAARNDVSPERNRCHIKEGLRPIEQLCRLGGSKPLAAVWADSHGVELAYALGLKGLPLIQITYSSCPPLIGQVRLNRLSCDEHNRHVLDFLRSDPSIEIVLIAARYSNYVQQDPSFWEDLKFSVDALASSGKRVFVIEDAPTPGKSVPNLLASGIRGTFALDKTYFPPADILKNATILPVSDWLCRDGQCPLIVDGMPLLFDDDHFSLTAALAIAPRIVNEVNKPPGELEISK